MSASVSAFVLRFLTEPIAALREQRRVLRPGGRCGIVVWGTADEAPQEALLGDVLDAHGAPSYSSPTPLTDDALDEPDKLVRALESAGFATPRAWDGEVRASYDADSFLDFAGRALDRFRQRLLAELPASFDDVIPTVYAVAEK